MVPFCFPMTSHSPPSKVGGTPYLPSRIPLEQYKENALTIHVCYIFVQNHVYIEIMVASKFYYDVFGVNVYLVFKIVSTCLTLK